ncbi:hypothetical protein HYG77_04875 [Rhodococcus sp. ZPP]|uniref:hypothetical protein n=1 Tax=Rhodococcus sp. ZPP TaxID=2749906 RepID=UPI001AD88078|nr:hypothetical protein [Rhodococcus sp. ZPP]QTJ64997.1 hypothetical protein HYG77_04875 [Rhodococcus sp. ZPP]
MTALSSAQLRLLRELDPWMILGLADAPEYWCKNIRDMQGVGTTLDQEWRAAGLWRTTYPWGLAMTAVGDYMRERKRDDPAHVVALTWAEITRWIESMPPELRAEARRQRKAGAVSVSLVVDQLLAHGIAAEQGALW